VLVLVLRGGVHQGAGLALLNAATGQEWLTQLLSAGLLQW